MKYFIFSGKVKDLRIYLKEWSQEEAEKGNHLDTTYQSYLRDHPTKSHNS